MRMVVPALSPRQISVMSPLPTGKYPVFCAVRQDLESEFYEFSGGINQTKGVGLQIHFISDDFEFYEIGLE
jgi:hypothetical protein